MTKAATRELVALPKGQIGVCPYNPSAEQALLLQFAG